MSLDNIIKGMTPEEFKNLEGFTEMLAKTITNGKDMPAFFIEKQKFRNMEEKILNVMQTDANICADFVNLTVQFNQILKDFCEERGIE